jgi:NADH-quinone oxidoreductase subunit N
MMPGVALLIPEIVLTVVAVAIYMGSAFWEARRTWTWLALAGIVAAAMALAGTAGMPGEGPVTADAIGLYLRWLALSVGAVLVLLAGRPLDSPGTPEFVGSLLLTVVGMMLVAASRELVLLFLGLEMVSIPTYILLYLGRGGRASQEAATKYFYLSILASATMLYGFAFLYGSAGTTDLRLIHDRLAAGANSGLASFAPVALVMIFAGLGFRITAVPFHFYAPDVFQGTSHVNAAFLSVVPKVAGFAALIRLVAYGLGSLPDFSWQIAFGLSIATMTVGNVMALWQENIRRMLAYSSIAQAGYMLLAFSVALATAGTRASLVEGMGALVLYLTVYAVATLGTFAALACLGDEDTQVDDIGELAGLAWTNGAARKTLALAMAAFMFSLAGIPPLAGFWGKLMVFGSALDVGGANAAMGRWFLVLAVIGVVNAAISAGYYLRVVGSLFFRQALAAPTVRTSSGLTLAAAVICLALALGIGLSPGALIRESQRVAHTETPSPRVVADATP